MSDPSSRPMSELRRFIVGKASDVPEGGKFAVVVGGREIGIYRVNGNYYALLNRCPHLGGPLCEGQIMTEVFAPLPGDVRGNSDRVFIACPWHNWEFDIRTGQSYWNPRLRARPIEIEVQSGVDLAAAVECGSAERVAGPYTAETLPVTVEDDYLVVRMRPAPTQGIVEITP